MKSNRTGVLVHSIAAVLISVGGLCGQSLGVGGTLTTTTKRPVSSRTIPRFLYVASGGGISGFSVNPENGLLKPLDSSPVPFRTGASSLAASVDGKLLFAADAKTSSITSFTIGAQGELNALDIPAVAGDGNLHGLAVAGNGQFLYAASTDTGSISGFVIDKDTGVLTPLSGSPFSIAGLSGIAAEPGGRSLFVPETSGNQVHIYAVSPAGSLTETPGSGVTLADASGALAAAADRVFSVNPNTRQIDVYTVDPRGALMPGTGETPLATSAVAVNKELMHEAMAIDPNGSFLYVTDAAANAVTLYPLGASATNANGAISFATGSSPSAIALTTQLVPDASGGISVSITNASLLTFSGTTGTIHISAAALNTGGSTCNGQIVQLAFSVPSIAVISTTTANPATGVCIPTGAQDAPFIVTASHNNGSATLTAFATNFTNGTTTINVSLRAVSLSLPETVVGQGHTVSGTVALANPAPAGGSNIALASSATAAATVSPSSVSIAAGGTSAAFSVTGVAPNPATLTATVAAGGYTGGTLGVTVVPPGKTINLPHNFTVAPGQTLPFPISIGAPATSAVTVALSSSGTPGTVIFSPTSVTVPAGATMPTTQATIKGGHIGPLNVIGSAAGFATDTETATVSITLTFNPTTQSVQTAKTATLTLSSSAVAPAGGFVINTAVDDPTKATVPSTVTIPQGSSSAAVTITGVAAGSTTLRAAAPGAVAAAASINVHAPPAITLYGAGSSTFSLGKDGVTGMYGTMAVPAPAGNLSVKLTSSNPAALLMSTTQTGAGLASINVQVPAGSTSIPTFYVQALTNSGSATVTAQATGYSNGVATANLVPSGFIIGSNLETTTFSPASTLTVTFAQLQPGTLVYTSPLLLRPGVGSITVALKNSNTSVGTLSSASLVFTAGMSGVQTSFKPTGTASGTSVIAFNGTPANFSTPANYQSATVTVNTPNSGVSSCLAGGYTSVSSVLGKNAISCPVVPILAAAAPAGGRVVTIKSNNTSAVLLSTSTTAIGTGTVTVNIPAGSTSGPAFYIQTLAQTGTVSIVETVPGYNSTTLALSLVPSGFIIGNDTTTTTFAQPSPVSVSFVQLDPADLNYNGPLTLRPGMGTVTVSLKNSNSAVGKLAATSVNFTTGNSTLQTTFAPTGTAAGTAIISFAGTPTNFSAAANHNTETFTVTAPNSGFSSCITSGYTTLTATLGRNAISCGVVPILATAAPAGGRTVTVTSSDTTKVLLSTSATAVGTGTINVNIAAAATSGPAFYIQTLSATGSVAVKQTVPGYNPATLTVLLTPSGFVIGTNTTTTTFSPASPVVVTFAQLDPTALTYTGPLTLRPGIGTVAVTLANSNPAVGRLGATSIGFTSGNSSLQTTFQPSGTAPGIAVISFAATPANFTMPANDKTATYTVNAPNSGMSSCITSGYTSVSATLGRNAISCGVVPILAAAAPTVGRSVTITSSDASKALLSTNATTVGSAAVTVNIAAGGTSGPAFYIQALSQTGSVTIKESVPGFNPTTLTLGLAPSGFTIGYNATTTTFSAPSPVTITFSQLDPATLNYVGPLAMRPGIGSIAVNLKNSNSAVGTLVASSVAFTAGLSTVQTSFKPTGTTTGTAVIGFNGTPANFTTPSNDQTATYIVNAPNSGMSSCIAAGYTTVTATLGSNAISCGVVPIFAAPIPAGGRTVTITSGNTAKAVLSTAPAVIGTGTVTVSAAALGTSAPAFYIQTLSASGTVAITETVPGYNPTTLTLTLTPSGFIIGSDLTTTTFSSGSALSVNFAQLDPTTLNYTGPLTLRPGIGTVAVALKNSNTSVGVLSSSSLGFTAGKSNLQTTFQPTGTAAGISVISFNGAPAGFATPGTYQKATITVTAPATSIQPVTVGKNLQTTTSALLAQPVPAGGRTITIQSPNAAEAVLSTSPSTAGVTTLTFNLTQGQTLTPTFYVQAHSGTGTVTLNLSAPGYANGTGTVTLYPSGFALQGNNFTTHLTDNPTTLTVVPAALDPMFLNVYAVQLLNPNQPNTAATLTMTDQSGTSPVGKITLSPVLFQGDDNPNSRTTSFQPLHAGSTLIKISSPAGFANASTQVTATVVP